MTVSVNIRYLLYYLNFRLKFKLKFIFELKESIPAFKKSTDGMDRFLVRVRNLQQISIPSKWLDDELTGSLTNNIIEMNTFDTMRREEDMPSLELVPAGEFNKV